jgi:hypothetical protein
MSLVLLLPLNVKSKLRPLEGGASLDVAALDRDVGTLGLSNASLFLRWVLLLRWS